MASLKFPERLLQPFKNLRQFQQELYAMHKQGGPAPEELAVGKDDSAEVVAYKGAYNAALGGASKEDAERAGLDLAGKRIRTTDGDLVAPNAAASVRRYGSHDAAPRGQGETRAVAERRREAGQPPPVALPARDRRPAPESAAAAEPRRPARPEPERPKRPPAAVAADDARKPASQAPVPEPTKAEPKPYRPPEADFTEPNLIDTRTPFLGNDGGGVTVYLGKVVSGSGSSYEVALYPDGPDADPGDTVTVTIPQIDSGETIPADTWISPIFPFTDSDGDSTFACQVPVWLS